MIEDEKMYIQLMLDGKYPTTQQILTDTAPYVIMEHPLSDTYTRSMQIKELQQLIKYEVNKRSFSSPGNAIAYWMDKKRIDRTQLMARMNMRKGDMTRLLQDKRRPSRTKVIVLSYALDLNADETSDFLKACGHADFDLANKIEFIIYCAKYKNLTLEETNQLLIDLGQDSIT